MGLNELFSLERESLLPIHMRPGKPIIASGQANIQIDI
jgi:hypothetical protein